MGVARGNRSEIYGLDGEKSLKLKLRERPFDQSGVPLSYCGARSMLHLAVTCYLDNQNRSFLSIFPSSLEARGCGCKAQPVYSFLLNL